MPAPRFTLAVLFQRTPLANRWIDERWEPIGVEMEADGAPASVVKVADDATGARWRFGGMAAELHRSEAEGYHLNLTASDPKVFVMWRDAEPGVEPAVFPAMVTVSYNQAARMMDGGEHVDAVPLPQAIRAWMEPFVAEHYKPEPRRKVRRNDPFADQASGGDPRNRKAW